MKVTPRERRPNPRAPIRAEGEKRMASGKKWLLGGAGLALAIRLFYERGIAHYYGFALGCIIKGIYEWMRGWAQVRTGIEQPH
jgi:hypothetical protein